jgi:hypothetical protein
MTIATKATPRGANHAPAERSRSASDTRNKANEPAPKPPTSQVNLSHSRVPGLSRRSPASSWCTATGR